MAYPSHRSGRFYGFGFPHRSCDCCRDILHVASRPLCVKTRGSSHLFRKHWMFHCDLMLSIALSATNEEVQSMGIRLLVFSLSLLLSIPPTLAAQTQAVTPSQLQEAIKDAAKTRKKNREDVQAFFSSEVARKAI